MENKELIAIGSAFGVVIALAMYMFISQQKNNNMVKDTLEVKSLIEQTNHQIEQNNQELRAKLDSLTVRMDETDQKYHRN
jgi:uncharacterized protein YjbK